MSCYTATLNLLPFREHSESFWSEFCIENVSLNDEQPIEIFDSGKYKLLVRTDKDGRIETVIYQSSVEGTFDAFKDEAIREIIKSLNRLEIAFIASVNFLKLYSPSRKTKYENNLTIEILNSDASPESYLPNATGYADGVINIPKTLPTASLKEINDVLIISHGNVDEYIDRFLSIKELSSDPVLHLVTLYALYEFIKENNESKSLESFENVKKRDSNTSLESIFRSTRHLVAHGFVGGDNPKKRKNYITTAKTLEEFLGKSDDQGRFSFNRYDENQIKLINEVINESQFMIHIYLKSLLNVSDVSIVE